MKVPCFLPPYLPYTNLVRNLMDVRYSVLILVFYCLQYKSIAQTYVKLSSECDYTYSTFDNEYYPYFVDKNCVTQHGIQSIFSIGFSSNSENKSSIEYFTKTIVDSIYNLKCHSSIEYWWKGKSWYTKDRWKIYMTVSNFYISSNDKIDSITHLNLDNNPKSIRGNYISKEVQRGDSLVWDESYFYGVNNKRFDNIISTFDEKTLQDSLLSDLKFKSFHDTLGYRNLEFAPINFDDSDTISTLLRQPWCGNDPGTYVPTYIINGEGQILRKIGSVIPGLTNHSDFYYDDEKRLKKVIHFYEGEIASTFYFYDNDGLISSIWEGGENGIELKASFYFQKKNYAQQRI